MTGILEPLPEQIIIGSTTINTVGWVVLAAVSIYVLSVYGQALRKRVSARLSIVVRHITQDVKILAGATAAVSGVILAVINPVNIGAAAAGLFGWLSPIWMAFVSFVMSMTNLTGLTDFGIWQVFTVALTAGVIAFLLRQTGFMEKLGTTVSETRKEMRDD